LARYEFDKDSKSTPEKNPVRYASFRTTQAVDESLTDYKTALKEYMESEEYQAMDEEDQEDALDDFETDWLSRNQDMGLVAGGTQAEAQAARERHLQEQADALRGQGVGEGAVIGEASGRSIEQQSAQDQMNAALTEFMDSEEYQNMSDEEQDQAYDAFVDDWYEQNAGMGDYSDMMTDEAGIQMAGGSRDTEGQAQVGIEKDPFAAAAQGNPQLSEALQNWQYRQRRTQELSSKNPEIASRLKQLGVKKPPTGGE
jgi:hypothetical protein